MIRAQSKQQQKAKDASRRKTNSKTQQTTKKANIKKSNKKTIKHEHINKETYKHTI